MAARLRRDLCETTRRAKGAQKVAAERKHGDAALVVLTHKQLLAGAGERPARKHLCSRLDSSPSVRASKQVRPRSRDSTREAALAVRAQVTCAKDWGVATGTRCMAALGFLAVKDANAVVLRVGDVHARRAAFLVRRCQREALRAREREWAGRGEHRPCQGWRAVREGGVALLGPSLESGERSSSRG